MLAVYSTNATSDKGFCSDRSRISIGFCRPGSGDALSEQFSTVSGLSCAAGGHCSWSGCHGEGIREKWTFVLPSVWLHSLLLSTGQFDGKWLWGSPHLFQFIYHNKSYSGVKEYNLRDAEILKRSTSERVHAHRGKTPMQNTVQHEKRGIGLFRDAVLFMLWGLFSPSAFSISELRGHHRSS